MKNSELQAGRRLGGIVQAASPMGEAGELPPASRRLGNPTGATRNSHRLEIWKVMFGMKSCVYTVDYIQYSTEAYIRYCTAFNGSCKRESTCRLVFELSSSVAPPQ